MMENNTLVIGSERITIEQIFDTIRNKAPIKLSTEASFISRIKKSRTILDEKLNNDEEIYGVTTGYGDSCVKKIPKSLQNILPIKLTRYHQCGLGDDFSIEEAKAIQIIRIISLSRGYSAVRLELLHYMVDLYNKGIHPRIPKEGSVGASGDLTPLAYYASSLIGEGEVYYENKIFSAKELYKDLEIPPIVLKEKEGLAIMNGTAVMTALATIAYAKAEYFAKLTSRTTAAVSVALMANANHFDEDVFLAKPHLGTINAGTWIRENLKQTNTAYQERLQDRYSIRCAPHIIGSLLDGLYSFKDIIEIEINSANDNPLINPDNGKLLHGGNFYGGHIAFAMDSLKVLIANISDLLDRQIALLVDEKFNNGLPSNLSFDSETNENINHGLKALQISSSAWTAECLKNTMPASVFSRSTECHNQDKVSMGTISARDCLRNIELTSQVISASIITSLQAIDLRINQQDFTEEDISEPLRNFKEYVRNICSFIAEDRPLEKDLRNLIYLINSCDEVLVK